MSGESQRPPQDPGWFPAPSNELADQLRRISLRAQRVRALQLAVDVAESTLIREGVRVIECREDYVRFTSAVLIQLTALLGDVGCPRVREEYPVEAGRLDIEAGIGRSAVSATWTWDGERLPIVYRARYLHPRMLTR